MKKNYSLLIVLALFLLFAVAAYFYTQNRVSDEGVAEDATIAVAQTQNAVEPEAVELISEEEETASAIQEVVTLNCVDCILAPVDKYHQLPASYAPTVKSIEGGQLTPEAATALAGMFAQAKIDGVATISLRSSYRSYTTQETTFTKWVNYELSNGAATRGEAEEIANTYSAKPGQSEHQLGTTVDILCSGCGFEFTAANKVVWTWLADNAQDFGFVLSYPEGREDETGYTYEPWHYRYIGEELAEEFNNQLKTLNNWLKTTAT